VNFYIISRYKPKNGQFCIIRVRHLLNFAFYDFINSRFLISTYDNTPSAKDVPEQAVIGWLPAPPEKERITLYESDLYKKAPPKTLRRQKRSTKGRKRKAVSPG